MSRRGFSLIAIALILVVLGTAIVLQLLPDAANKSDQVIETQRRLDRIRAAIGSYYRSHNALYPCPARLTDAITTNGFGVQASPNCKASSGAGNKCSSLGGFGIICSSTNTVTPFNQTWIGAVPVRDIGLGDDYEFDAWGNRFTYAVNNNNTSVDPLYNLGVEVPTIGRIVVKFHALSHGPNGIGAYTRTGALLSNCAFSGVFTERENCDYNYNGRYVYQPWDDTVLSTRTGYDDISFSY